MIIFSIKPAMHDIHQSSWTYETAGKLCHQDFLLAVLEETMNGS